MHLPRYGPVSDHIISPGVMLWNGRGITVSDSSHQDLFWAMQGAKTHKVDAMADMVEKFSDLVTTREMFAGSFIMIEQYPSRAVRAVDEKKSAIP
jgi:hypothetical protein